MPGILIQAQSNFQFALFAPHLQRHCDNRIIATIRAVSGLVRHYFYPVAEMY